MNRCGFIEVTGHLRLLPSLVNTWFVIFPALTSHSLLYILSLSPSCFLNIKTSFAHFQCQFCSLKEYWAQLYQDTWVLPEMLCCLLSASWAVHSSLLSCVFLFPAWSCAGKDRNSTVALLSLFSKWHFWSVEQCLTHSKCLINGERLNEFFVSSRLIPFLVVVFFPPGFKALLFKSSLRTSPFDITRSLS